MAKQGERADIEKEIVSQKAKLKDRKHAYKVKGKEFKYDHYGPGVLPQKDFNDRKTRGAE